VEVKKANRTKPRKGNRGRKLGEIERLELGNSGED